MFKQGIVTFLLVVFFFYFLFWLWGFFGFNFESKKIVFFLLLLVAGAFDNTGICTEREVFQSLSESK